MCAARVPRVLDMLRDYLDGVLAGVLAGAGAGALAGAVAGVAGGVVGAADEPSLELPAGFAGVAVVLGGDVPERLSVL